MESVTERPKMTKRFIAALDLFSELEAKMFLRALFDGMTLNQELRTLNVVEQLKDIKHD